MKAYFIISTLLISQAIAADEAPKIFDGLFKVNTPVKGQIGMVLPPAEIDKYVAKVQAAARKDEKWFIEYSAASKPGLPLPYHEKLGLTKEEYADYMKIWKSREFKAKEDVMLWLRESPGSTWTITATGEASPISTLRYDAETDTFQSPNGKLTRLEDISADETSTLGAWTGKEWKFEEENSLGKTKENFAIGTMADKKHGLLVYRLQELSVAGTRLLDRSIVVRFPLSTPSK